MCAFNVLAETFMKSTAMSDAALSVVSAGPHVSIQDAGRSGFMRFGVPMSGPMDRSSFVAANLALGNNPGTPAIEVSMGGISIECDSGDLSVAVAGGAFVVESTGLKTSSWTIIPLRAGERLTVRSGPWGSWTYLAFAGELLAERWLRSASTHVMSGFGGGKVAPGQRLFIRGASRREEREGAIPRPVTARTKSELHVVLGPQDRFFTDDALITLLSRSFYVSGACDRMGATLEGPALVPKGPLDILSEPIIRGSIQVSGDGTPTILLADHQTTGGYPKIATVLDCELDTFVQMRGGDEIRFISLNPLQAINLARGRAAALSRYYSAISQPGRNLAQRLMGENLISGVVDARSTRPADMEEEWSVEIANARL